MQTTIQVGGYKPSTLIDFEIPKKYGLQQTIADTLGIGGIMRGLRTIPVLLDIAKDIMEVCPQAFWLQYVNPMCANMIAINKIYPNLKSIGLCHSVQGTAEMLAKDLNEKGLDKFEIQSKKPETLLIKGLSLFLSESVKLNVKVVNKDVVLFKSIDQEKNYSESGIITRKTGELIHEITKNIKSENAEKYISIYSCTKHDQKV